MDKIVGAAVIVLIAVSIWAVLPSQEQTFNATSAQTAQSGQKGVQSSTDSRTLTSRSSQNRSTSQEREQSNAVARNGAEVVRRTQTRAGGGTLDMIEGVNAQVFRQNPVALKRQNRGTQPDASLPSKPQEPAKDWDAEVDYHDLERALMAIYSKRTVEGGLPKNLVAGQILPENVLQEIGVSSTAGVVMIGDHFATETASITDTLNRAKRGDSDTGFSFADPNQPEGHQRFYLRVLVD